MQGYVQDAEYQYSETSTPFSSTPVLLTPVSSLGKDDEQDQSGGQHPARPKGKRQVSSNACEPCRKRKSKCDNAKPTCRSCSELRDTNCHYDIDNDMRRKGGLRSALKKSNKALEVMGEVFANHQLVMNALATAPLPQAIGLLHVIRADGELSNTGNLRGIAAVVLTGNIPEMRQPEAASFVLPENDLILDRGYGDMMGMPVSDMGLMPPNIGSAGVDMTATPAGGMGVMPSNMKPDRMANAAGSMVEMPPNTGPNMMAMSAGNMAVMPPNTGTPGIEMIGGMAGMQSNAGPAPVDTIGVPGNSTVGTPPNLQMVAAPVTSMSQDDIVFLGHSNNLHYLNQQQNAAAWQQGGPVQATPQGQGGYFYPQNTGYCYPQNMGYYPPYPPYPAQS